MTEETNAAPNVPFVDLLASAGVSPEVWRAMTDARRREYERAYLASKQRAAEKGVADHVA